jgi:voltage-gated potassium channel
MSANDSTQDSDQFAVPGIWLLLSLFCSLIIVPLVEGLGFDRLVLRIAMTATIVIAVVAILRRHVLRIPAVVLAVVLVPAAWMSLFVQSTPLFVTHCVLGSVFFGIMGGVVLLTAIKQRFATGDSVLGAISAYLLFGLAWAFMYWGLDNASPDSFNWPDNASTAMHGGEQIATFSRFVYYSMVTMSTLGYGDITPVSNMACTFAWMQSVTGQFYVAVLVAWLVSALPRPETIEREVAQVLEKSK